MSSDPSTPEFAKPDGEGVGFSPDIAPSPGSSPAGSPVKRPSTELPPRKRFRKYKRPDGPVSEKTQDNYNKIVEEYKVKMSVTLVVAQRIRCLRRLLRRVPRCTWKVSILSSW